MNTEETQKIFCIGNHKTNVAALNLALVEFGYRTNNDRLWYSSTVRRNYRQGRYKYLYDSIEKFDALLGSPFDHKEFYKILFTKYPNAKFILTTRKPELWYNLFYDWLTREVYRKPKTLSDYNTFMEEWYDIPITKSHFSSGLTQHKDSIITAYAQRNQDIITFFQEHNAMNKLLVIDLSIEQSPWNKLGQFLQKEPPKIKFPAFERYQKKIIQKPRPPTGPNVFYIH